MVQPYIGVTGFMNRTDVEKVLTALPANCDRKLMVGVLVSWKTVNGIPNKWPNRYPQPNRIAEIFSDDPRAFNLIHYNTKDPSTLCDQMRFISEQFAGKRCHGFQLNVCWPDPRQIEEAYKASLMRYLVLQVGGAAFEAVRNNSTTLARKIQTQYPMVEYVLLDPSGGLGQPLSAAVLRNYLYELYELGLPHTRFGVAGGLSPATMHILEPLAREFPGLSIDAEGRLRDADDHLNTDVAREYVKAALNVFENNKSPQE